jgi:hypothetical protein
MSDFCGKLPEELITRIIEFCDQPTQKQLRLACRQLCRIATPPVFAEVTFSYDKGGTDNAVAISQASSLASQVRQITLRRASELRSVMACNNVRPRVWDQLSLMERHTLVSLYEKDRNEALQHSARLAQALLSADDSSSGCATKDVRCMMDQFAQSVCKFKNATKFCHEPLYTDTDYRDLRQQLIDGLGTLRSPTDINNEIHENEVYEHDAIQLYIGLRALLHVPSIRSIEISVRNVDLFTDTGLYSLLFRSFRSSFAKPTTPQTTKRNLSRFRLAWRSRLYAIKIRQDINGARKDAHHVAEGVSQVLQATDGVETLHLQFSEHERGSRSLQSTLSKQNILQTASARLLSCLELTSFPRLRTLKLSLVTTEQDLIATLLRLPSLRHLLLIEVALLPGKGDWSSILQTCSDSLLLESLDLACLHDCPGDRERRLFDSSSPRWRGSSKPCFVNYKRRIITAILVGLPIAVLL